MDVSVGVEGRRKRQCKGQEADLNPKNESGRLNPLSLQNNKHSLRFHSGTRSDVALRLYSYSLITHASDNVYKNAGNRDFSLKLLIASPEPRSLVSSLK